MRNVAAALQRRMQGLAEHSSGQTRRHAHTLDVQLALRPARPLERGSGDASLGDLSLRLDEPLVNLGHD